jgi:hypothetical protein
MATGKGAHLIILDDPFKAAEAASDAVRNSVYDWFKGSLMTRFDNPAEGAVIVVMQRLHQDDLVGRLRDKGGWEYLAMPGECFERTVYDLGDGESWTLNPGDLLYPERFNRTALDQLALDLGEAQYNAQILQRPSPPGGALIKLKHFQRYETPPHYFEAIVQSWDPAVVDTETAAFSGCTTWGHPRPQALSDRRAAQKARLSQDRARHSAYERKVQRRLRGARNSGRRLGDRQRGRETGRRATLALPLRPYARQS